MVYTNKSLYTLRHRNITIGVIPETNLVDGIYTQVAVEFES